MELSHLTHAALAGLAVFLSTLSGAGAAVGLVFGIAYYLGREGAEAQWADPRPKGKDWAVPFTPWVWPLASSLGVASAVFGAVGAYLIVRLIERSL